MRSWEKRIELASEFVTTGWLFRKTAIRGFTEQDRAMSEDWATCPCGQAGSIPRDWSKNQDLGVVGRPVDRQLSSLGMKFNHAVWKNHVDCAMVIYRSIQRRAAELAEEQSSSENSEKITSTVLDT